MMMKRRKLLKKMKMCPKSYLDFKNLEKRSSKVKNLRNSRRKNN